MNSAWQCPWCEWWTNRSATFGGICPSRLCVCGALGLGAAPSDPDEITDDAIKVFGIPDGHLTPFDADRMAGLRRIGVGVAEGPRVISGNGSELRVLWFLSSPQGPTNPVLAVTRILDLISSTPNARTAPVPGDIQGDFDLWFDGGAVKHHTGISRYQFADGATASTGTSLTWQVGIRLPDGRHIRVSTREDPVWPPTHAPAATPEIDVTALRDAFGPFSAVFEPRDPAGPTYRSLLHLSDGADVALDQIREAADAPHARRFLKRLFQDAHWWPGFVAGVAYLWDRRGRFDRRWLWKAIDSGNWAMPQLVAIAFLTDKRFVPRARRRIEAGSVIRPPLLLSLDPYKVRQLGGEPEQSSKLLASIVGISPMSPGLKALEPAWRADPRFTDLFQQDEKYDRADRIASSWLGSITKLLAQRDIQLTPAETLPRSVQESLLALVEYGTAVIRRLFPAK